MLQITLKKALKKIILDTCKKTAFSCNNKIHEQIDEINMGGSLGPMLANVIMTEIEKVVAKNLVESNIITFHVRFVDDKLVLMKCKVADFVLKTFIRFTADTFDDCVPHFVDEKVCPNDLEIFRKATQTRQYINIESFTLQK